MEFKDKTAVVTGGAMGIGEASALGFAREGAAVVVVDINEEAGQRVVSAIRQNGGKAIFLKADVSKAEQVQKIPETAVQAFGGIDILFNNAGIQHYGTVVTTPEAEWDHVLGINLKSVFLCSKYCIPEMQKRGGGAIVNTASVQSFACQPNVAPYTTSKAGVLALTRSIAVDFAKHNIRCNAICPGSVDTPMLRGAARQAAAQSGEDEDAIIRKWGKFHPLGRVGTKEEVAELVLFLASHRAAFITGAAYLIDGGLTSTFFAAE